LASFWKYTFTGQLESLESPPYISGWQVGWHQKLKVRFKIWEEPNMEILKRLPAHLDWASRAFIGTGVVLLIWYYAGWPSITQILSILGVGFLFAFASGFTTAMLRDRKVK
jgi:hypothetical protein